MRNSRGQFIYGHPQFNSGKTWWKKGHQPWNKGLLGFNAKKKTGKIILCKVCKKKKYFQLNQLNKRPCLYCSVQCARIDSRTQIPHYQTLHTWVTRKLGRAREKLCTYCGSTSNVDWANISQQYKKDLADWMTLCKNHHVDYDHGRLSIDEITSSMI